MVEEKGLELTKDLVKEVKNKEKEEAKEKIAGGVQKFILTMVGVIIVLIVFIFNTWSWISELSFGYIFLIVLGVFVFSFAIISKCGSILSVIGTAVVVSLIVTASSFVLKSFIVPTIPGELVGGYWDSVVCMIRNPENLQACQYVVRQVPEGEKEGSYQAVDVKFGSKYTPTPYSLYPIQVDSKNKKFYKYSFNVEIKNPNKEKAVDGFYIDGYLSASVSDEKEEVSDLYPQTCASSNKCKIGPERELTTVITSEENKDCGKCKDFEVTITAYYPYSAEGTNAFLLLRSEENFETAIKTKAIKSAGPLDVVVYFTPEFYVPEFTIKEITVHIYLGNKEKGVAKIKNIKIVDDTKLLKFKNCTTNFGEPMPSETFSPTAGKNQVKKEVEYTCKYEVPDTVKLTDTPYKTLPFKAIVDYDYEQTYTQELSVTKV